MPLFEHQFIARAKTREGEPRRDSPRDGLRLLGPVLQVVVAPTKQHLDALAQRNQEPPEPISGLALIDTGASMTAVDEEVCRKLGLQPTGVARTSHAGGSEMRACYPIQLAFPGTPFAPIVNPRVMSVNLHLGKAPYIVLFGRDLLAGMKFVYNGPAGRIEIAF